ncbi:MAG TPA: hypothetical protein VJB92_01905 [Candidatus Paceibacterota bacterium]
MKKHLQEKCAIIILAAVLSGCFFIIVKADDFSSNNYKVRDPVMSGGGGYSTSSNFQLWSAVAQPAIGTSTSDNNELRSGFLYFVVTTPSPTPTPTPSPTPSPSQGGGIGQGGPLPPPPKVPPPGPPFIGRIISFITGEPVPERCIGVNRSDLNCDGEVDLRDLSILFSRPRAAAGRVLSLLFSDWTRKLPVPEPSSGQLAGAAPTPQIRQPKAPQLAEISSSFGTSSQTETPEPKGILRRTWAFIKRLASGFFNFARNLFGGF